MFIRRTQGPTHVTLADGRRMSRADLPPPDTRRWVASRKAAVVQAVDAGLISPQEAVSRWDLSEEELDGWRAAAARHGFAALRATAIQHYRDGGAERSGPSETCLKR
ncbi:MULTISPECIES: CtrA inhibitor SciP [Roseicyclus]|jgi:hypothetical protein|uniref:CtrA inhibitor SciP n=1 Tax=Roseicyclus amphidinii TaxID=3034232 RepID=UPI0024E15355|nr:DUF1153 domain-containing protein [Roseicyclus sp. Amp-Y-6]